MFQDKKYCCKCHKETKHLLHIIQKRMKSGSARTITTFNFCNKCIPKYSEVHTDFLGRHKFFIKGIEVNEQGKICKNKKTA